MTRTSRKRIKNIKIPQLDLELFNNLKKIARKNQKNNKVKKIQARHIFDALKNKYSDKERILTCSFDLRGAPLQIRLQQEKRLRQKSNDDVDLHWINRSIKQLQRRGEVKQFASHRYKQERYKRHLYIYNRDLFQSRLDEGIESDYDNGDYNYLYYYYTYYIYPKQYNTLPPCQDLDWIRYRGEPLLEVFQHKDMSEYIELSLGQQDISDQGIRYLSSGVWSNLEIIDLGRNNITNKGVKELSKMSLLKLVILRLGQNMITEEAISHLSKADWPLIEEVNLENIGGIAHLCKTNFLNLSTLILGAENYNYFDLIKILLLTENNLECWEQVDSQILCHHRCSVESYREKNGYPTSFYHLKINCQERIRQRRWRRWERLRQWDRQVRWQRKNQGYDKTLTFFGFHRVSFIEELFQKRYFDIWK